MAHAFVPPAAIEVRCHASSPLAAGRISTPSTLSYLDNGVVYVGSRSGDSQLIRLHAEPLAPAAGAAEEGEPPSPSLLPA
jgi:hypothetical protein